MLLCVTEDNDLEYSFEGKCLAECLSRMFASVSRFNLEPDQLTLPLECAVKLTQAYAQGQDEPVATVTDSMNGESIKLRLLSSRI